MWTRIGNIDTRYTYKSPHVKQILPNISVYSKPCGICRITTYKVNHELQKIYIYIYNNSDNNNNNDNDHNNNNYDNNKKRKRYLCPYCEDILVYPQLLSSSGPNTIGIARSRSRGPITQEVVGT